VTLDVQLAGRIDRDSLFHPFTSVADLMRDGPRIMVEGKGVRLRDIHGQEYLDGMAGLWCVTMGYGREEIVEAIAAQSARLSFFHAFNSLSSDVVVECAEMLKARAPMPTARIFFGASGSDANETQLKLIWYYNNLRGRPEKKKIIARWGSYHGSAVATGGLSGLPSMHGLFDLPQGPILHTANPHFYRYAAAGMSERQFSRKLAEELDAQIEREGPGTVAAFFAEPVMGAGGLIPPPEGYFEEILPVLEKHDVLLVADEVITGFGRLGTYWGCQSYGLQPDLLTTAKGLTSGYFPASACLVSPKIWDVIESKSAEAGLFAHGFTYSAHPVGAAAAIATLKLLDEEKIVEGAAERGDYLLARMRDAIGDHPLVGEIRGRRLMLGVELVRDRATKEAFPMTDRVGRRLLGKLFDRGLVSRALGDTLVFAPPLVISKAEIDELVDIFSDALNATAAEIL